MKKSYIDNLNVNSYIGHFAGYTLYCTVKIAAKVVSWRDDVREKKIILAHVCVCFYGNKPVLSCLYPGVLTNIMVISCFFVLVHS